LIEACTGVPIWALQEAKKGLIYKSKWLPSVSEVVDFLDKCVNPERKFAATQTPPLNPHTEDKFYDENGRLIRVGKVKDLSPEERAAQAQRMAETAELLRKTTKATQRASMPAWQHDSEDRSHLLETDLITGKL
jgi:hypothetical protein